VSATPSERRVRAEVPSGRRPAHLAPRRQRGASLPAILAVTAVALGLVALAGFFLVAPGWADASLNAVRTDPAPAPGVSERARALHASLVIADLHADTLLWDRDPLARGRRGHVDLPRLREGNVAVQMFTIVTQVPRGMNITSNRAQGDLITPLVIAQRWPPATWFDLTERARHQARRLEDATRRSGGRLVMLRSAADLSAFLVRRAREPGVVGALLGVEGMQALEGDPENVGRLFDAGVRMMAPTHFTDNAMAGSAHGESKGGLTPLGRAVIRRMEARRMLVDLAHASPATIDDVLAMATRPLVVSHTGVRGTCDNARNLDDRQLAGIARTGGLVAIGYWPTAVCGDEARASARAIRYAADRIGVAHVALGSDFDGAITAPFDASGLVQLTDALLAEGFGDDDIAAIMGGNTVRLLARVLP
jgi:microsomal dipeptidase-like Zn-dependent dipeptidase